MNFTGTTGIFCIDEFRDLPVDFFNDEFPGMGPAPGPPVAGDDFFTFSRTTVISTFKKYQKWHLPPPDFVKSQKNTKKFKLACEYCIKK